VSAAAPVLMTRDTIPVKRQSTVEPLDDAFDHVRGPAAGRLILEYGDYECPYSRRAFRAIERVEQQVSGGIRFAFRHFPLEEIHPHALAAAAAAEAAALQGRFWDMHELLFHRQKPLADDDLRGYATQHGLDVARFDQDRVSPTVLRRIRRDVESGTASGEVRGTPTLFIDGIVHRGGYDATTLMEALAR
jgi:protein-disulfide isomerase